MQRYGKLVIDILAKIITIAVMITLDKSSSKAVEPIQADIWGLGSLQVGLYLGPYPAVVLYDYEDARDLFNQDVVSGMLVIFHIPTLLRHWTTNSRTSRQFRLQISHARQQTWVWAEK